MPAGIPDPDDEFSNINVTPLVDIILVLLVIFMITAPSLYHPKAMKVELPKVSSTNNGQEKGVLTVNINRLGVININNKTISIHDLIELVNTTRPPAALILADKKTEHGQIIAVLDALKKGGINKFSFGVEENN